MSDPQKRRRYDSGESVDFGAGFRGGSIFEELFSQAFGFDFQGGHSVPVGQHIEQAVTVDFEDVLTGAVREIEYERVVPCDTCGGSGARPGSTPMRCPTCAGRGQVQRRQQTLLGNMVTVVTCPECGGSGQVIDDPCPECHGEGVMRSTKTLTVEIPPGIQDGQQLKYDGYGDTSADSGRAGDLYVRVDVNDHGTFERRDNHIYLPLQISVAQAALGDRITVPTLESEEEIEIRPGTETGDEIRLRGQGLPQLRNPRRGDQVVHVRVKTPADLTDRQVELLQEFAREEGIELNPPPNSSFFDRVKQAFGG
ncbi:MAG: DnaJ C-terminal domain-containing protein [Armatimonadota bacterium]